MTAFSVTNGSKTSKILAPQRVFTVVHTQGLYAKFWRRKEFLLLCIRKACMLRYCALSRSLVKIRVQDTHARIYPTFQNTSFSLFDFIFQGYCKDKKKQI